MRDDVRVMGRLLGLVAPLWRRMALSVLLGTLTIASSVGLMATSAWMISKAGLQPSIADLGVSVVGVRFFGIARAVFRYLERLVSHDTTFRLLAHLRVSLYRAIEPLAPARLSHRHSGDLLSRVMGDVETLENVYLRAIAPPLVGAAIIVITTALIAAFDGWAALVALAFMGLAAVGLPALALWTARHHGREVVAVRAELNTALVDQLHGMADRLAYGQAGAGLAHIDALSGQLAHRERVAGRLEALQTGLGVLLVNGAMIAVLAVAIPRVDSLLLATLALATFAAFEALTPLGIAANHISENVTAARRLFEITDAEPVVRAPDAPHPVPARADIAFERVTFRYSPDAPPVLDGFSLTVAEGEHVAIIGESGAGKSTLVNLLTRLWDAESGSIRIGGVDVRDLTPEDVREQISVMSQRTHLFNTTLRENIRIGRPDATDTEVEQAARRAQIHDFICRLPNGYDTYPGEDGAQLSGGERQRIALARALLRDSPILILDEPTASLDAPTERAIMQAIYDNAHGRTVILVTHRLPLLDRAGRVIHLRAPVAEAVGCVTSGDVGGRAL